MVVILPPVNGDGREIVVVELDALAPGWFTVLDVGAVVTSAAVVGGTDVVRDGRAIVLGGTLTSGVTAVGPPEAGVGAGLTRKYNTRVLTNTTTSSQVDLRSCHSIRPPRSE